MYTLKSSSFDNTIGLLVPMAEFLFITSFWESIVLWMMKKSVVAVTPWERLKRQKNITNITTHIAS